MPCASARDDVRRLGDVGGGLKRPRGVGAAVCLCLVERDAAGGLRRSGWAALLASVPSKAEIQKGAVLQPRPYARVRNGSFSLPARLVGFQISNRGPNFSLNFNAPQCQLCQVKAP